MIFSKAYRSAVVSMFLLAAVASYGHSKVLQAAPQLNIPCACTISFNDMNPKTVACLGTAWAYFMTCTATDNTQPCVLMGFLNWNPAATPNCVHPITNSGEIRNVLNSNPALYPFDATIFNPLVQWSVTTATNCGTGGTVFGIQVRVWSKYVSGPPCVCTATPYQQHIGYVFATCETY
ncbi:MAG: hypothetical protein ACE5F1_16330 [Planctomycetota bacterium]